ncbi:arsenate reductase [Ekhidna lutea]|uniref:Arsenate reductase n=1 Tax=Ekhidna lutea TaxID=447679 RepID=A0A239FB24_EKHLU|nr:protein-tyrosine-phosphatase [Ekhidna lutea]SNS53362.1 arsenate reductase [Ekhidna lutea]
MIYPSIKSYLDQVTSLTITDERKSILNEIVEYIKSAKEPKLNFICTHNSRRSHLSQIWAQTMAYHFGVKVQTYSGGTEATAFHPNAVAAIERAGFKIQKGEGKNPSYKVGFSDQAEPLTCYSKTYDDSANPSSGFAAIMTCSEADAECPIVFGADARIKLIYEDPKVSDGTGNEEKIYGERSAQIAAEMHYVFSQIKS